MNIRYICRWWIWFLFSSWTPNEIGTWLAQEPCRKCGIRRQFHHLAETHFNVD